MKYHKDDDGRPTRAGDEIYFSFGIPPLYVTSKIVERDGKLFALTPDCSPKECRLDKLRSYVGAWYRKTPSIREVLPDDRKRRVFLD
jgi:hypothetical protein